MCCVHACVCVHVHLRVHVGLHVHVWCVCVCEWLLLVNLISCHTYCGNAQLLYVYKMVPVTADSYLLSAPTLLPPSLLPYPPPSLLPSFPPPTLPLTLLPAPTSYTFRGCTLCQELSSTLMTMRRRRARERATSYWWREQTCSECWGPLVSSRWLFHCNCTSP